MIVVVAVAIVVVVAVVVVVIKHFCNSFSNTLCIFSSIPFAYFFRRGAL